MPRTKDRAEGRHRVNFILDDATAEGLRRIQEGLGYNKTDAVIRAIQLFDRALSNQKKGGKLIMHEPGETLETIVFLL